MDRDPRSPPLIRPIPRRPFDLASPTPPEDDSPGRGVTPNRNRGRSPRARFLGAITPSASFDNNSTSETLSRAASILNLTTSTLFGIYSPSSPTSPAADDLPSTPWGTGAETPPRKTDGLDDATFELLRDRAAGVGLGISASGEGVKTGVRRPSHSSTVKPPMTTRDGASLFLRVLTLFVLGVGYGALVGRLRSKTDRFGGVAPGPRDDGSDWKFLLFWGVTGVAMGGLLPWFDRVWEEKFGKRFDASRRKEWRDAEGNRKEGEASSQMDWALVVRGIGAFVGIVFAIRKLAWTSTMQVSLALALANPFLWYLIDRSKTGFLLSAAMGIAGTAVLLGLDPDMMPTPTTRADLHNVTGLYEAASAPVIPSQETVETGMWIVSVLFCSCVCFGNIGRRLAPDAGATARGRWGGVR